MLSGVIPKQLLGRRSGPPFLADVTRKRPIWPAGAHHVKVTPALAIGLVLATWTVLPFPLALLVGRSLRTEPLPTARI
jgi:hypothetical protein